MNNPNDDEAPTKTGAANPSSSQASGLNATNERQSLTLEQLRKDFGGNKRQNIQGTALGPPAPPGEESTGFEGRALEQRFAVHDV
jgi:hypothetical protein